VLEWAQPLGESQNVLIDQLMDVQHRRNVKYADQTAYGARF
jgi:hypothetical protein